MLMNTGHVPVQSRNQLLTTVAWQGPQALAKAWHSTAYALEGSVFMAGATVQWLRDGLQIIQKASDVEALAASVPNTNDVYLIPAFAGLGAKYSYGGVLITIELEPSNPRASANSVEKLNVVALG
jgi:glycerol kinase